MKLDTNTIDLRRTLNVGVLLALFPPIEQSLNVGNLDMAIIAMTAWALASWRFGAPLLVVAMLPFVNRGYIGEWIVLGLPSMNQPVAHYGNWSLSTILVYPDFTPDVS